eukprot:1158740-Rhodomonas_salina.2
MAAGHFLGTQRGPRYATACTPTHAIHGTEVVCAAVKEKRTQSSLSSRRRQPLCICLRWLSVPMRSTMV